MIIKSIRVTIITMSKKNFFYRFNAKTLDEKLLLFLVKGFN